MKLRRFLRLAPQRRRLLVEAAAGLLWTAARLRRSNAPAMAELRRSKGVEENGEWAAAWPVAWAVRGAARHLPGKPTCLPQAIVAQTMLRRRAMAGTLHIGAVLEDDGRLAAHAWIELDGRVLIGDLPDLDRFIPLRAEPAGGGA